jgi:DnaD/phage-associated family protein
MAVFRINKNKNYTTISNYHLQDKELSLKAKGLLSVMLSLPIDWDYSVKGLEKICIETPNTINSILQELEKYNYLERKRIYCNGKISEWEYNIYETKNLYLKNQDIENQDIENLYIENQDVNKYTKEQNTKEYNNNIYKHFENIFTRTLNGIEVQMIDNWLQDKTEEEIINAINECAKSNIDNFKYIQKVLYSKKKKVNPSWFNKEITSTEEIVQDEDFKNFIEDFRK